MEGRYPSKSSKRRRPFNPHESACGLLVIAPDDFHSLYTKLRATPVDNGCIIIRESTATGNPACRSDILEGKWDACWALRRAACAIGSG